MLHSWLLHFIRIWVIKFNPQNFKTTRVKINFSIITVLWHLNEFSLKECLWKEIWLIMIDRWVELLSNLLPSDVNGRTVLPFLRITASNWDNQTLQRWELWTNDLLNDGSGQHVASILILCDHDHKALSSILKQKKLSSVDKTGFNSKPLQAHDFLNWVFF